MKIDSRQKSANGSCLCGAIHFSILLPSKWAAHCHCTMCQRAHGAAFVTWVGSEQSRARIVDPQSHLRWFASSQEAERGFCACCGSTLFFRSEQWPGELHITYANFNQPLDRQPQVHVFWDSHVNWLSVADDGLPRKIRA